MADEAKKKGSFFGRIGKFFEDVKVELKEKGYLADQESDNQKHGRCTCVYRCMRSFGFLLRPFVPDLVSEVILII